MSACLCSPKRYLPLSGADWDGSRPETLVGQECAQNIELRSKTFLSKQKNQQQEAVGRTIWATVRCGVRVLSFPESLGLSSPLACSYSGWIIPPCMPWRASVPHTHQTEAITVLGTGDTQPSVPSGTTTGPCPDLRCENVDLCRGCCPGM